MDIMVKITAAAMEEIRKAMDHHKEEMNEQYVRLHMGIG
jgi:hypothetical protein